VPEFPVHVGDIGIGGDCLIAKLIEMAEHLHLSEVGNPRHPNLRSSLTLHLFLLDRNFVIVALAPAIPCAQRKQGDHN
jgi:hypothetical protein